MSSAAGIEKRMQEGEFTKNTTLEMVEREEKKHLDQLCEFRQRYKRVYSKIKKELNKTANEMLMEFDLLTNVKLYMSTDRKIFREFSTE